jgi:hypothetical protein
MINEEEVIKRIIAIESMAELLLSDCRKLRADMQLGKPVEIEGRLSPEAQRLADKARVRIRNKVNGI